MIVACHACDSRYDVTGRALGGQLTCKCGTVLTLKAPSTQARLLACPQCGAGVAPTSHHCAHCASALMLKACPRCLERVFHGHKHCPNCGAGLDVAATTSERRNLACPRCTTPLQARMVGDIVIDECAKCCGLFLDSVAIERVIADRQQSRAEALLGALPRAELRPTPAGGKLYIKCPTCGTIMNRRQFATGAGVIVDVCKGHGTFFDIGELPAVIDFVMKGGLEKAQKVELERQRERLRRERESATTVLIHGPVMNDSAGALVDLLIDLFR